MDNQNKNTGSQVEIHLKHYIITRRVAVAAAAFALIISILMITNYTQIKSIDPLNSEALNSLMSQLKENPQDQALKEQIRALDLLARKAYFTHQWQIRTGAYILFFSVLVFLIAIKYLNSLRLRFPDLTVSARAQDNWQSRLLSRKYLILTGLGIFALALLFGLFSENELEKIGREIKTEVSSGNKELIKELRANWPGFRGPEGNGISYQKNIPTTWDGEKGINIRWKQPLPLPGFNSPIIWKDKLFISGADEKEQKVFCIDRDSGKIIWQTILSEVPGSPEKRPKTTNDTGYAASTATTDGQRVYVVFATGDIAGLDFSGKIIWAKNIGVPENHYGHSSSLILHRDRLLIQYDQNSGGTLIALNTITGEEIYKISREVGISWASPILVNTGSRMELILNSNPLVMSYDPGSGKELWRVKCMTGEIAPSPAYDDGMVFVVNEYARLAAIKLGQAAEIAWEWDEDLSEVSSLLAAEGLLVMAASYGTVTCYDNRTGKLFWRQEFDEGFYSSPILAEDKVYLMNMSGVMFIFKLDQKYQLLNSNKLGEKAVTVPAFADGRIYIRGEKNLYCIGSEITGETKDSND